MVLTNDVLAIDDAVFIYLGRGYGGVSILCKQNHFRSHFSPFQINTKLFFLQTDFCQKTIGTSLYGRSMAISNMKLIGAFWIQLWSA